MFALLNFEKEKTFLFGIKRFVRSTAGGYYTEIICPRPKNNRQRKKLIKALKVYEGKIIYPIGYYKSDLPKPYSAANFKCRILLKAYLNYLKQNKPCCAAINWNSRVNDEFCIEVSRYVDKVILTMAPQNRQLQLKVLSLSGTPIIYGGTIPRGAAVLDLDEKGYLFFSNDVAAFNHGVFEEPCLKFPILPKPFKGHEPFSVLAAMNEVWKREDHILFFANQICKRFNP